MNHAVLLISCPDQKGITASVTAFIFQHNGNIVHADQHIDEQSNTFFMRVEWSLDSFVLNREESKASFKKIADQFKMTWELSFTDERRRLAVFVSRHLHCLQDVLSRHQAGQLDCDIALVISNHPDGKNLVESYGIPFHVYPIIPVNKSAQEAQELALLREQKVDFIFLARYHQIVSPDFIAQYPFRIINIHHSFLPAFAGKNPYARAYQKGVKLIGATSHYVTETLDDGPIIEQDTVRVSHRDTLEDMVLKGQDLERIVAFRALRWHINRRILCYGNKTVIFD